MFINISQLALNIINVNIKKDFPVLTPKDFR